MSLIKKTPRVIKPPFGQARLKQGHPLNQGLVGWWLMNEGGGLKAYDLSGKGNHGTLTNGPTWTGGRIGQALSFDGTDDYIATSTNILSGASSFTVSVLVKSNNIILNDDDFRVIFGSTGTGDYTGIDYYVQITKQSGVKQVEFVYYASGWKIGGSAIDVDDNVFHHVVVSHIDNVSDKVFVDGIERAVIYRYGSASALAHPTSTTSIGRTNGNGGEAYFSGKIDDVRIWNRALSAGEVQSLYSDPLAALEPLPRIIWAPSAGAPATATNRQYSFVVG